MRLVLLTQYYPPETGAPQNRLSDLARRLAARGHDVRVLTALPNYPLGRVFEGWRGRLGGVDRVDGIPVLRSWILASPRKATVPQLAGYGSFALSSALAGLAALPARADVLMWESPPLFLAPTAWALARRLRARLVMNVSDLWPKAAVDLGVLKDRRLVAGFEALERWAYRSADLVTHQTDGLGTGIRTRWPGARTLLFPNGVDLDHFVRQPADGALRQSLGIPADVAVVGYGGNFGRAQALHQVVEAAACMVDRPVVFLLMGAGPCRPDVEARVRELGLANVRILDPVPRADLPALQSLWDVSVVPLADAGLMQESRPSKMFELMAMEVPFVFCGRGEGADLAAESGGATVVDAERPEALAAALGRWLDAGERSRRTAGRMARAFVAGRFDRAAIADRLEEALLGLLAPREPPAGRRVGEEPHG